MRRTGSRGHARMRGLRSRVRKELLRTLPSVSCYWPPDSPDTRQRRQRQRGGKRADDCELRLRAASWRRMKAPTHRLVPLESVGWCCVTCPRFSPNSVAFRNCDFRNKMNATVFLIFLFLFSRILNTFLHMIPIMNYSYI